MSRPNLLFTASKPEIWILSVALLSQNKKHSKNEERPKNEDDLKNEEDPINEDGPKNEDNPKKEDHFNNEDILNNGDDRKNKANILKDFHSSLGISNFAVFLFHHPIYPPQVKSLVSPVIYYDVTWQMETIKLPDHEQCQDYHHYQHYLPGDQDKLKHRMRCYTRQRAQEEIDATISSFSCACIPLHSTALPGIYQI